MRKVRVSMLDASARSRRTTTSPSTTGALARHPTRPSCHVSMKQPLVLSFAQCFEEVLKRRFSSTSSKTAPKKHEADEREFADAFRVAVEITNAQTFNIAAALRSLTLEELDAMQSTQSQNTKATNSVKLYKLITALKPNYPIPWGFGFRV